MKIVLIAIVLLLGVIAGYPLLNEDSSSACSSVERRYLAVQPLGGTEGPGDTFTRALANGMQGLSNGALARDSAKRKHPAWPAFATCTWYYWESLIDPQGFVRDINP